MSSRKKEQRLWDRMRKGLPDVHLERIENLVGVGTPDVLALRNGAVTWCELKSVAAPPLRPSTPVLGRAGLSVEQRNWHLAWRLAGGRSLVVVGVGTTHLFVIDGSLVDLVNAFAMTELTEHTLATNWSGLRGLLEH